MAVDAARVRNATPHHTGNTARAALAVRERSLGSGASQSRCLPLASRRRRRRRRRRMIAPNTAAASATTSNGPSLIASKARLTKEISGLHPRRDCRLVDYQRAHPRSSPRSRARAALRRCRRRNWLGHLAGCRRGDDLVIRVPSITPVRFWDLCSLRTPPAKRSLRCIAGCPLTRGAKSGCNDELRCGQILDGAAYGLEQDDLGCASTSSAPT